MTIATLRRTAGHRRQCALDSQKAANLARDDRGSLTIDHDTPQVVEITGLSMAALHACRQK